MAARSCGILLAAASLPGRHGFAELGDVAEGWLDWLAEAGQGLWQLLPLGPPGRSSSPYDGLSSFAGEPALISLEALRADGLLDRATLQNEPPASASTAAARAWKTDRLRRAWTALRRRQPTDPLVAELESWCAAASQSDWLDDWALWAALRERHGGRCWTDWPSPLRDRQPRALAAARRELAAEVDYHRCAQFLFWRQWSAVRRAAAARGIALVGDLPIYCALDSADVWRHRELFDLDARGRPRHVAGVPPDAFSADGQLWGHALYRWRQHRAGGFSWWVERLRHACCQADLVRIDHFRGFAGYWQVPAEADAAAAGRWRRGPGAAPFEAARAVLGGLPLVAEDLGHITEDVHELRRTLGLPGTRVLQFGLEEGGDSPHLPERWDSDVVAYTGTHDNDTCRGWLAALEPRLRDRVLARFGCAADEIHWAMIAAVHRSAAGRAVVPAQDVLGLGPEARLNVPGRAEGNWAWRLRAARLTAELAARLRRLSRSSGRLARRSEDGAPRS